MTTAKQLIVNNPQLLAEISQLIQHSKYYNAEITLLYWHIGQRINQYILGNERAEYGKEVIKNLSKCLTEQFGKGWGRSHLNYCVKFSETFCDLKIVHALREKLSWTHFKSLIYIDAPLKREFMPL